MKAKIFLLITFLTFLCRASESAVVDCEFGDGYSWGYVCEVQNSELITSKDDREISEVRGQHWSGKSNDDVKWFRSNRKKVSFFPIFKKVFKNVDTVRIYYSEDLKEITREDLKQFGGKLKRLDLERDGIEVLEADLFEDNQNLEELYLSYNNIRHIEDGALTKLKKLSTFIFNGYPCTQLSTIEETEKACKDPKRVTTTTTQVQTAESPKIAELQNKISILAKNLTATTKTLASRDEEFENLKKKKDESDNKVTSLEIENSKLSEEIKKLKAKVEQENNGCGNVLKAFEEMNKKFDQQSSKFESKIDQIPSKVVGESTKILSELKLDLKESQKKNLDENFENIAKVVNNLSQTVNTMGDWIGNKVEEHCKKEEETSAYNGRK